MEMYDYFDKQTIEDIIRGCNDIYDWHYTTRELDKNSVIHRMAKEQNIIESEVALKLEWYACGKFENIVKLFFLGQPYRFIK